MGTNKFYGKRLVTAVATAIIVISLSLGLFFFLIPHESKPKLENINVAYPRFESLALFWVAEEQGYFVQNGLNVTTQKHDTGVGALNGMIKGEAEIAVGPSEFPLVGKAFQNEEIKTIGSIDELDFIYLIERKDRGIEDVSDLAGKKVGTAVGTVAEFYLGRLLVLNGLSWQNITLVEVATPSDWVNAVVNGTIDAVVTAQPHANSAKEKLMSNAFVWPAQSSQPQYALIVCTSNWISEHPDLVVKFLSSLKQAEEYVDSHPGEAKAVVKAQLNLTDQYMETVWSQNQYGLSLDQSLLFALEDEARWMIDNGLANSSKIPVFRNYIYIEGLESVKPESVNIIR